MKQNNTFEYDDLNDVDLDNMVSEVKSQSYNQEVLKGNFQIILKELRSQRNSFKQFFNLDKENKSLKASLADMAAALKKLISQVKQQADQLEKEQEEAKNRQEDLEKRLNSSQTQVQSVTEQQKEAEKKQQIVYIEMNFMKEKQQEIEKVTKIEVDTTKDDILLLKQQIQQTGLRVDTNAQAISSIKSQITEVKSQYSSMTATVSQAQKKMITIEEQNAKIVEQIDTQAKDVHSHSISIKDLYEQMSKAVEATQNSTKQISVQQQKLQSLESGINVKNAENDKEFYIIKDQIEQLKKLIEVFEKQLKQQSKQFGHFITKDTFDKAIKDLKDSQIQWSTQFEITLTKEIEELKKYLANQLNGLVKLFSTIFQLIFFQEKYITQDDLYKFFSDLLSKAADKGQTKKALLYLENLILSILNMKMDRVFQLLIYSNKFSLIQHNHLSLHNRFSGLHQNVQLAQDLDNLERIQLAVVISQLFFKQCNKSYQQYPRNTQNNNFLCCPKALQVNLDKSIISTISVNPSPKFNLRPQSAKSSNQPGGTINFNQPKYQQSQNLFFNLQNVVDISSTNQLLTKTGKIPNNSLIINVDLDIVPSTQVNEQTFEDKKIQKGNQLFQSSSKKLQKYSNNMTTDNYHINGN